jgi:hypothetical protein
MPSLARLQAQIQRLSLTDKQALQAWLAADIEQEQQPPAILPVLGREVVETQQAGRITYQCERIKCGKSNCRCASDGSLHGPYWYGYRKEKGRLKSWYIGKNLKLMDEEASATLEST